MSVPSCVLYSNGFNSAVEVGGRLPSDKARFFRDQAVAGGWAFVPHNCFYYDSNQMDRALTDLLVKLGSVEERPVLMGTSLGGLVSLLALGQAERSDARAVLINPVIDPGAGSLADTVGTDVTNYVTGETHSVAPSARERLADWLARVPDVLRRCGDRVQVHLDEGDETLNSARTAELCRPHCLVRTYPGGSHRFEHWSEAWQVTVCTPA